MTAPESAETPTGKYVEANGLHIYFEEHGQSDGPPLILIHGGSLTGASWKPYLEAFGDYRVIAPDSRGHGRTTNPGETLTFGLMAEDVAAFVKALDLPKPFIAGYSDGGQVVLEIGIRYPDLAQGLIIGGAYPELPEASIKWVESILGEAETPDFDAEKLEREDPQMVDFIKASQGADHWQAYLRQMKPLWNQKLNYTPADFAKVVVPTLLLRADRDELVSIEETVTLYRALPHAELAIIPGSDHGGLIFSLEKIALVRPLIADFLQRQKA